MAQRVSSRANPLDVERMTTCSTAGPMFVDVKDGQIVRVNPIDFSEQEKPPWEITVNGMTYSAPARTGLLPWGQAFKYMQTHNRVGYPMKRVDWDPNGERNPEKRGISGYERISWDEALDIIANEMRKTRETKGSAAIGFAHSAHLEWGSLHFVFSDLFRFWHLIGSTYIEFTPNSWEGWACGTPFLWGDWQGHGLPAAPDSLQDASRDSELIVLWGADPIMHDMNVGIVTPNVLQYWKSLGKEIILIEPYENETGVAYADRWIPIYPGTDGALACAIAYVWITEGLYDQDYLDTHAVGFDDDHLPEGVAEGMSFKAYILGGGYDGVAKTPEWAAAECGVEARIIYALARQWGTRPTMLWCMMGGLCRREFAHNTTRLLGTLQIMQGIGKPGIGILGNPVSLSGPYDAISQIGPAGFADGGMNAVLERYYPNPVPQKITFQKLYDCLNDAPQSWQGGHQDNFDEDMFFEQMDYPMRGCSEVEFIYQQGSTLTNPPHYKHHLEALRSPQLKTFVVAAPWFDRDCRYADIVLPAGTVFERADLSEPGSAGQYAPIACLTRRSALYSKICVPPYGESLSDMDIYIELSRRLGLEAEYMEGNTEDSILEKFFDRTEIPMTYEEFKDKGYYVWPKTDNYVENKQFESFYKDPEENALDTPSGLFEIFSEHLFERYGNSVEIPPIPQYTREIEGRFNDELRKSYPLQLLMAHPKLRFHGKYNNCEWLNENYKVIGPDGYKYEPVWMNPADAAARGLKEGDIVLCHNKRGRVLAGVRITNRLIPSVAWLSYGAWHDPLSPEEGAIDRGGDANILSNNGPMSIHHVGGAYNSSLFEIERVELDELAQEYPEGWAGKYRTWEV